MLKLAINAVNIDAGGGLTGLLGYLRAWRQIGADLDITLYASRRSVLSAVRAARPDVRTVAFAEGVSLYRRFLDLSLRLGPLLEREGHEVVMTTNMRVERCRLPQVVHHRNLLLFERKPWRRSLDDGPKRWLSERYARRALRLAPANVFISRYMQAEAERFVPGSGPRSVVIHNGLADDVIAGADRPSRWSGEADLLAISSEEPHKDNATLVRIMAELVRRRPDVAWRLDVASTGAFEEEKRLAERLDVARRIRWPGFVSPAELDERFRRSLCLLYTSRLEGFGNPPLEAMARRCPVIACRSTAIPEVVGDAAPLVPPGDATAFAASALEMFDDAAVRRNWVDRGVDRVRGFRWTDSATRFLELLHGSVRSGRVPVGSSA